MAPEFADRWSFGGATAIDTNGGTLRPSALLVSSDRGRLDAWLTPVQHLTRANLGALAFEGVTIVDDRGPIQARRRVSCPGSTRSSPR